MMTLVDVTSNFFIMNQSKIINISQSRPNAQLTLVCFPYAGGGPGTYFKWKEWLPEHVELLTILPPGRGSRFSEKAHQTMSALVDEITSDLTHYLTKPFIFFGHSLGSRVAFEVAMRLHDLGKPLPAHFIASGSNAPHYMKTTENIATLPTPEFIQKLKENGGTPLEILENKELMEVFLPLLRADFKVSEGYLFEGSARLPCPLSIFSGQDDPDVTAAGLEAWNELFVENTTPDMFPGGHFFIYDNESLLRTKLTEIFFEQFACNPKLSNSICKLSIRAVLGSQKNCL